MQPCTVWIRLELPDEELRSLKGDFPEVDFLYGEEAARDPREFDAVFTEKPLPDDLVGRMPRLRWLHVTRGGAKVGAADADLRRESQAFPVRREIAQPRG